MIAVGADHAFSFVIKHAFNRRAGTDLVPHSRLGLQVEADLIRGFERCFRWTPRMKAHVIETPRLCRLEDLCPRGHVSGRIAGQRKIAAIVCAAKIDRHAVERELISFSAKISQADSQVFVLFEVSAFQPKSQRQLLRMKLIPLLRVETQWNFYLDRRTVFVPAYRN